ncbi:TBC1 domain family member 13 isoform X2 [Rhodamnia argentea]|uniref:TBC1 domain family member 13 isoform X2 n=1 Tax=Rhodamnia argentea TaxID=178133 RepID=A0ABM3HWJ9_9MYRT|nr:TBC1 domain family member 13 isoform X2 [Rhodamnia argentea]
MVKKRVPDWLNSSLWSSAPPPDDERLLRYASKYAAADRDEPPATDPPAPVPPPVIAREEPAGATKADNDDENGGAESPSGEEFARQAQLLAVLSKKVINVRELRRIASPGIPDSTGVRPTVWKLLLGYLPPDRGLWPSELAKKRSQYKNFKVEVLTNPSEITRRLDKSTSCDNDESKFQRRGILKRSEITHGEHPLSLGQSSIWNQFFQDAAILEQIDRDVKRTHPDIDFFSGDSAYAKSNQDALRNILTVFAKLNPGIRYVQGMNEILAPLFFVLRNDPDEGNALDNSVVGIRSTITRLSQLLKEHDEELWRHLEVTTKVNPQFYAFRWITLLLTQEFSLMDILHIWDTLLSDPEGPQETLLRICCAMLILVRRRLLAGDFTANLKLLQHYPSINISHLLYVANKLRSKPSG